MATDFDRPPVWVHDPDGRRHPGREHARRDGARLGVLVQWEDRVKGERFYRWVAAARVTPRDDTQDDTQGYPGHAG